MSSHPGFLSAIADAVILRRGWRRALLAFLAGCLSVLALAPIDFFPVLWITVPVFVWLLDGAVAPDGGFILRRLLPAAAAGWWFGFGYFLAGLWWIGGAFLVDANEFGWLLPIAVTALPAALALFWSFGAAVARLLWCEGWPRVLAFALSMSAAEWLRGHLFTGFPWNAFGYALLPRPLMMQASAVVGLWGMTLLAFLVFAAPVLLAGGIWRDRRSRLIVFGAIVVLLVIDLAYGALRLREAGDEVVEGVQLRLVQPAIAERDKWDASKEAGILTRYLDLSNAATSPERNGVGSATHLIWPESAFPFLLTERADALKAIADLLPSGTTLITGAARAEPSDAAGARPLIYNSIYAIDDRGEILDAYDKVHLVPFGEYLPFQSFLEGFGLRQLTRLAGGFSEGSGHRMMALKGLPVFSPLICYEAVFPDEVASGGERPGWLLNVTNDAWYGDTPGPRQHLRQAVLRAVEQGLPLVRDANNGISAIVDPYGRIVASLDLGRVGVVDGPLPAALPPTFYSRFGDWIFVALMLVGLLLGAIGRWCADSIDSV